MKRWLYPLISALSLVTAGCNSGPVADGDPAAGPACDRACIIAATNQYLLAIATHDPSSAPLADDFALVENLQRQSTADGLWKSATGGPSEFAIHVPDVTQQQAGWLGLIEQGGKPALLALRLKFENGRIAEAEHIVTEPAGGNLEQLTTVRAGLLTQIPANARLPHDELIRIGATYYDALDDNDGTLMPFAQDCQRNENGMITAGNAAGPPPNADPDAPRTARDCAGQISSQAFTYIDRIDDRRMVAADPVTGLVMGFSHFRHSMENLPYRVTLEDGSTAERNRQNMPYDPFDMPAAHIFKIGPEGKVHEIEAVGAIAPYRSPSGWD